MTEVTATYAADHYVQRLDLGGDPFISGGAGDYFYAGGMRRQLLDQIIHFSRFGDQVVLLTGSTGSGTSTLLSAMISQLQPVMDCCVINGEVSKSPEHILESLSEQLQLDTAVNFAEFLSALIHTASLDEEPEPVLIAIDQAHFLGLESFELLRHLFDEAKGVIHLLLVGEYQVEQLSKLAGLDSGQMKLLELEPLTVGETGDYLLGLLQSVGYAGEQPLSSDQLAVLHEQSGGNVVEINLLAPALLAIDEESTDKRLRFAIPTAHIAAIGILGVALVLSYLYQGQEHNQMTPVAESPSGVEQSLAPVDVLPTKLAPSPPQKIVRLIEKESPISLSSEGSVLSKQPPIAVVIEESKEPESPVNVPVEVPVEVPVKVLVKVPVDAKKTVAVKKAVVTPPKAKPLPTVARVKPVPPRAPSPVKSKVKSPAASKVQARRPVVTPATAEVASVATMEKIPPRERRLLNLPAGSYMLQLLGTVDEQRARNFVKKYVGRLSVTYFYVVLSGPYDDMASALVGTKVLPERLQKQKPWVRSVASIQKDIRAKM